MTTGIYAALGQADFLQALQNLLPSGPAWPRDPDTVLNLELAAVADGLAALHARAGVLSETESDPSQTTELLADWESAFGLPDPCTPLNATVAQRRAALLAKIVALGGATPAYFISVAAALGYTITIRNGISSDGTGWQHMWFVTAPSTTFSVFRTGQSAAGDYLTVYGNTMLECVLNRIKPAHTKLFFNYV